LIAMLYIVDVCLMIEKLEMQCYTRSGIS